MPGGIRQFVGARLPAMVLCQSMNVATDQPNRGQARSYGIGGLRLTSVGAHEQREAAMAVCLTHRIAGVVTSVRSYRVLRSIRESAANLASVGARWPAMASGQSMNVAPDRPNREQGGTPPRTSYRVLQPVGAHEQREAAMAVCLTHRIAGVVTSVRSYRGSVWAGLLAAFLVGPAFAAPLEQLKLVSEHPVDAMVGGNLSGLAVCNGQLWAISDRDDNVLYRMDRTQSVWQAQPVAIEVPDVPESNLPVNLRSLAKLSSYIRGGSLDFEGISCDAQGNKYVVSEAHAEVLKVPVEGSPVWLTLPAELVAQARAKGMLQHFNAIFEGLAISPEGDRLWLAAERDQRGLLVVHQDGDGWRCKGSCVLRTEPGKEVLPPQVGGKSVSRDFADLSLFNGKLYALERSAYRICRRTLLTGATERCWSFSAEALKPDRLYEQRFGLTEALVVDETGAWVGVDNNFGERADGEKRPIVWRFAAPAGGWSERR